MAAVYHHLRRVTTDALNADDLQRARSAAASLDPDSALDTFMDAATPAAG